MSNPYYNHGTYPVTGSSGSSAAMRAELSAISAGFDLLPTLSGNGGKYVLVNAAGSAMTVSGLVSESGSTLTVSAPTLTWSGNPTHSGNHTWSGTTTLSALTASQAVFTDASKNLVSNAITGTGNVVMSTSPTLVTPILGTPTSVTLTNATGLPLSTGVTGTLATTNGGTGLTSFTSGGVVYASSTSALATGSALTFDGTSLGIGVASPGQLIDGTAANPRLRLAATTTGYSASQFANSSGSSYFGRDNSVGGFFGIANGTVVYSSTNDPIGFFLGTNEQMRLTSTGLGIGTSSPGQRLEIQAPAGASQNAVIRLRATDSGSGVGCVADISAIGTGGQVSALAFSTRDGTNILERMRLDGAGNLGIGTSSPATLLDLRTSNGVSAILRLGSSSSVTNSTVGTIEFYDGDADDAGIKSSISNVITGNVGPGGSQGGNLLFSTATSGASPTERMRLDSSGNLGIGTSSPGYKLDVAGTINSSASSATGYNLVFRTSGITTGRVQTGLTNTSGDLYTGVEGSTAGQTLTGSAAYSSFIGTFAANPLYLVSNATIRATLDSSGNLGIGTSSPSFKLHVSNYMGLGTQASSGAGAGISMIPSSTLTNWFVGSNYVNSGAFEIIPSTAGGGSTFTTPALVLNSSGNLGIGTNSPAYKLDAQTTATGTAAGDNTVGFFGSLASGRDANIRFGDSVNASARIGYLSGALYMYTNAAERLRIDLSGNVGIGVTSMSYPLDVKLANNQFILARESTSNITNGFRIGGVSNESKAVFSANSATGEVNLGAINTNYFLTFSTNGANERARISSDGTFRVKGAGTAGSTDAFQVSGSAPADAARLDSSGNLLVDTTSSVDSNFKIQLNAPASGVRGIGVNNAGGYGVYLTYDKAGRYSTDAAAIRNVANTPLVFETNNTERARITSGGDLLVGTTSQYGSQKLSVNGGIAIDGRSAVTPGLSEKSDDDTGVFWPTANNLGFSTGGTERARITSGGFFKASNDGTYVGSTGSYHELRNTGAGGDWTLIVSNLTATAANAYGARITYTGSAPNGTGNPFLSCDDTGGVRFVARSNGGLANYSGNDVNLSDRREKTNFAPAKSYLDTICAIPVQTFNYIDQSEDDPGLTLGVVAQDVQAVAPELVMESNWGTAEEPKMRFSIYQTDLQYALMKCVQELKAELDSVKAELATLKGQP